jgi:diguanylate cyclase (GGDEF)-like protein
MSEVVSRFTFLPADERQALRIRRFFMAAGTSALVSATLFGCALLGLLPMAAATEASAGIGALVVIFFLLFRSGLNLRFPDPSLTAEQIGASFLCLAYIMYYAGPAGSALTLFYPVAMLFGALRLDVTRLMALALLAVAAHAAMLWLSFSRNPGLETGPGLTALAVLAVVLPWFAVMGGYVNRLRSRLSDSHRRLRGAYERIEKLAVRDELTGVYNRRFLMEALSRERARLERLGATFSLCLLDVDHFKAINDAHGHAAGDVVLVQVARIAGAGLRAVDVFGRYGGEEFLLILPATPLAGARVCAERVRAAIEQAAYPGIPPSTPVRATLGIAEAARGEDIAALVARADRALYAGKAAGRNRVSIG